MSYTDKLNNFMQLKSYQQNTIKKFSEYLDEIRMLGHVSDPVNFAFYAITRNSYQAAPEMGKAPFVCIQVPTGGGKTLIASHMVGSAYAGLETLRRKNDAGIVLWLVPTDSIRTQTINKLKDRNESIRQALDERFENKVVIMDNKEALSIKKSDVAQNICIIVTTFATFRREDTDDLKVFQDNGALHHHFENLVMGEDEAYSLVNVIKRNNPLIIVDEGHNAATGLSLDMFKELNPSMVVEFTATPRSGSNVLVRVPAQELKNEKMIKLPVYIANSPVWEETIKLAVEKRDELEKLSEKNDEYVRPILLVQAEQEKEADDRLHVAVIRNFLINDLKIPEDQIAIRTGKQNELGNINLFKNNCPIRYIITVDALKEGWDCSFAYVLASVKNLSSKGSVEQLIGRVLRLPYAKEQSVLELNASYVYAFTDSFQKASESVVKGLQGNGYTDINIRIENGKEGLDFENETAIKAQDIKVMLPLIAIEDDGDVRPIEFLQDLVANQRLLEKHTNFYLSGEYNPTKGQIEKVDLDDAGEVVRAHAGEVNLEYQIKDITFEGIVTFLSKKIQKQYLAFSEVRGYVKNLLEKIVPSKVTLSDAYRARYYLLDKISRTIDEVTDTAAKETFDKLLTQKKIFADEKVSFEFPKQFSLTETTHSEHFTKHLYDKVGHLNDEEKQLALAIDRSEKVRWWIRNPEFSGFYLQGWGRNRFFPDFIVGLENGDTLVVEYKGEHLITNDDSKYKKETGDLWAKLGGNAYKFQMVDRDSINKIF